MAAALCLLAPSHPAFQAAPAPASLERVPALVAFTPASAGVDPKDGSLWLVDQYVPRVAHLARDGTPLEVFPSSRYGGGKPAGITFEGADAEHLYVTDPDQRRLVRIGRNGSPAGAFSTDPFGVSDPADVAWDEKDSALWLTDPGTQQVLELRPRDSGGDGLPDAAELLRSFSTAPLGSFNPMGVAKDDLSGHLFLSDPALDGVLEVTTGGALVAFFDSALHGGTSVTGLDRDPASGNLLLADSGRKILTVTPAGAFLGVLGTAPFGSLSPQGLAWDAATSTFLMVTGERKMIRFQPDAPDGAGNYGGILLWRQEWTSAFGSIAPTGVAVDPATGDRFVSDGQQHRVFRVDDRGRVIAAFDTAPAGSPSPTGLALGPGGGSLFLSDAQAREIFEVSPAGAVLAGFSTSRIRHKPRSVPACDNPEGVAYDAATDHLLIADPQASRVYEVTRSGTFVASFSTAPHAPYPTDLAVDPAGDRVVVSDSSGHLAEFSRSGTFRGSYPGVPLQVRIPGASGVSVEPEGLRRVVTDPSLDAVFFLSQGGAVLEQVSLEPYGIQAPSGAAWSVRENHLYVTDRNARKLFDISPGPDGAFGTADDLIASISTAPGGSDAPRGVALDPSRGRVGWGDEISPRVTWVSTSLGYLGTVDLRPAGATVLRGLDQDPTSQYLFLTDASAGILTTTSSGDLLQTMPAPPLGILDPGGAGLSPREGALLVVDLATQRLVLVELRPFFLREVEDLSVSQEGEIRWSIQPLFTGYELFRGILGRLAQDSAGVCFWSGPGPAATDGGVPPAGGGWSYLVAGSNPTGLGSLGKGSDGTERLAAGGSAPSCP